MRRAPRTFALAGALTGGLVCGMSAPALGAEADGSRAQRLEAQVRQLQSRVAELEDGKQQDWMTERRAEQVKTLVRDVLADAETRATLLQEGVTAGHDGKFFLRSADDSFLLELEGHLQARYIWNSRDSAHEADPNDDDNLGGFQIRRAKFKGEGHIYSPRLTYDFSLAGDRDAPGSTVFEDYVLGYEIDDNWEVTAGRMKLPFALQNLTSSSRQLAVERSSVHEHFRVDRSEGVELAYSADGFNAAVMVSDGAGADFSDFDANSSDFAITGRAQARIVGDSWDALDDPATAWDGEPTSAYVGGAVHYELGETGTAMPEADILRWTGDVTVEANGFGVMAAIYGHHTDMDMGTDFDDFGALVEAGYFVIPDELQPFVRYELIVQDDARPGVSSGATEEETSIITAGFNWYQHKHDAKFTMDVVYALDPLGDLAGNDDGVSTGLGLRPDADGEDGQFAVRAQYQIKW